MVKHLSIILGIFSLLAPIVGTILWANNQFDMLHEQGLAAEYRMIEAINQHEDFMSGENRDILNAITTSQDDINFRIGVLTGRLLERGEK